MKFKKKFKNGQIEVEAQDVLEALYDVGEIIEFNAKDYEIIFKDRKKYILKEA